MYIDYVRDKEINESRKMKSHRHLWILYVLPIVGVGLAFVNSWRYYSYWADELGSVSMALLPITEVIQSIRNDVHPPLYQILLKVWVQWLGSNEPTVRLLSLCSCLIALAYLYVKTNYLNFWGKWCAVTILTTSFLFSFYSQEARSYALTFLFATILTVEYITLTKPPNIKQCATILAVAIILSLTHYFGLLLALTVLFLLGLEYRKVSTVRITCICGIAASMIWPAAHYYLGLAKLKATKNAWMTVDGPLDTIRIFSRTFIPELTDRSIFLTITVISVGIIVCIALTKNRSDGHFDNLARRIIRSISIIAVMLIGIAAIDSISPISTERNFIVLLPVLSLMIGLIGQFTTSNDSATLKIVLVLSICLIALNNLNFSYQLLSIKWAPQQNWRATAQYAIDNLTTEKLYYLRNRDDDETERVFNFYVSKLSNSGLHAERIYIEQIEGIKEPAFLILGGAHAGLFSEVQRRRPRDTITIFQPMQSLGGTTGVIIIPAP